MASKGLATIYMTRLVLTMDDQKAYEEFIHGIKASGKYSFERLDIELTRVDENGGEFIITRNLLKENQPIWNRWLGCTGFKKLVHYVTLKPIEQ